MMKDHVKPRRPYESRRRREQAEQTRQVILAAAGSLFRERGYGGTAMTAIAEEAGVVVETIYRNFGSKRALFRAVIEAVAAHYAAAVPDAPQDRLDGLTVDLVDAGWWFNLRPSNTEPLLRLNLEAPTGAEVDAHVGEVRALISQVSG